MFGRPKKEKSSSLGAAESWGKDLLELQVNLIVTDDGMTAQKAPAVDLAVDDLADRYERYLESDPGSGDDRSKRYSEIAKGAAKEAQALASRQRLGRAAEEPEDRAENPSQLVEARRHSPPAERLRRRASRRSNSP